jgi:ribosomal protein S18 acetylase RimI-like enzyme
MSESIEYGMSKASRAQLVRHLSHCDTDFVPPLSDRVEINDYAGKLSSKAMRFEAWSGDKLVGLVAAYCNDQERRIAFITSVSVLKEWKGRGIAENLVHQCIAHARVSGMRQISLEVASDNLPAIGLYEKSGFVAGKTKAAFVAMDLYLE